MKFSTLAIAGAFSLFTISVAAEENARLVLQIPHANKILSVNYSPDKRYFVSTAEDDLLKIWSKEGRLLRDIPVKNAGQIAFNHDSKMFGIVAGGRVQLYSNEGSQVLTLSGDALAFHPKDDAVLIAEGKELFYHKNYKEKSILAKSPAQISKLIISPEADVIAAYCQDSKVRLWNINGGLRSTIVSPSRSPQIFFDKNGRTIHVITNTTSESMIFFKKKIFLHEMYDLDGKLIRSISGSGNIHSAKFSDDMKLFYAGFDGWLRVYDDKLHLIKEHRAHFNTSNDHDLPINGLDIDSTSNRIISGAYHGIKIWDQDLKEISFIQNDRTFGSGIAFSGTGEKITWGGKEPVVFDAAGTEPHSIKIEDCYWVEHVDTFQDSLAAFACQSGKVQSFSLSKSSGTTFKPVKSGRDGEGSGVYFDLTGEKLITTNRNAGIKIWDRNGSLTQSIDTPGGRVYLNATRTNYAYHFEDGKGSAKIHVYSTDGKFIAEIGDIDSITNRIAAIALHPNGKLVAVSVAGRDFCGIIFYDLAGKRIRQVSRSSQDFQIGFSPSGSLLFLTTEQGIEILTDEGKTVSKVSQLVQFYAHENMVFHPNEKILATIAEDTAVRLWSVATGELLATLVYRADSGSIIAAADGRFDYSGNIPAQLHWVVGNEVIGLEAFKGKYHTPGLLKEILSSSSKKVKPLPKPEVSVSKRLVGKVFQIKANGDVIIYTKVSGTLRAGRKLKILNGPNYVDATISNTLHTNVTAKAKGAVAVGNPVFE